MYIDENGDAAGNYTVLARRWVRTNGSSTVGLYPIGTFSPPQGNRIPVSTEPSFCLAIEYICTITNTYPTEHALLFSIYAIRYSRVHLQTRHQVNVHRFDNSNSFVIRTLIWQLVSPKGREGVRMHAAWWWWWHSIVTNKWLNNCAGAKLCAFKLMSTRFVWFFQELLLFDRIEWVGKGPTISEPRCGFRGEKCISEYPAITLSR